MAAQRPRSVAEGASRFNLSSAGCPFDGANSATQDASRILLHLFKLPSLQNAWIVQLRSFFLAQRNEPPE
jgi:hypothetical protein